jgi:hypothetical protein
VGLNDDHWAVPAAFMWRRACQAAAERTNDVEPWGYFLLEQGRRTKAGFSVQGPCGEHARDDESSQ